MKRLSLPYRPPFLADVVFGWLAARALQGVESVERTVYARTVQLPRSPSWIELSLNGVASTCEVRTSATGKQDVEAAAGRARHLLDLDCDPEIIATALSADRAMAGLLARYPGVRIPGAVDGFELAVRAVIGQQISVAGARTFANRMVQTWGERLPVAHRSLTHLFPSARVLTDAKLESIGLTGRQASTIRLLAGAVSSGELSLEPTSNHEDARARLVALPGIGDWTASYIALRALRDPDAFPAGDLGLRRAARELGLPDSELKLRQHAERWRPWRSYAAMLLWASLGAP